MRKRKTMKCKLSEEIPSNAIVHLARVVQKVDSAIHRINDYPLDSATGFAMIYPLDSDLSGG